MSRINHERLNRSRLPKAESLRDGLSKHLNDGERSMLADWAIDWIHGRTGVAPERGHSRNPINLVEQIAYVTLTRSEAWEYLYRLRTLERRRMSTRL